jgi:hypothetical protein
MQAPLLCCRGRNVVDLAGILVAYRLAAMVFVDELPSPDGAPRERR